MKNQTQSFSRALLAVLTIAAILMPAAAADPRIAKELFVQSGMGGRNFSAQSQEVVSVRDFGAVPGGTTDNTAAFQKAANAANVIVVPYSGSGPYLLNSDVSASGKHFILHGQLSGAGRVSGAAITQFDTNGLKLGNKGMFGYADNSAFQIYGDLGQPTVIQPMIRAVVQSKGDNKTFIGSQAGYFEARDRTDVTASNKGVLYAMSLSVVPSVPRNNVPFDDVVGLTISNTTGVAGARGTDAIYISTNPSAFGSKTAGTSEWHSLLTADANADVGIVLGGRIVNHGIDLKLANIVSGKAVRIPNNTSIVGRDSADGSDRTLIGIDTSDIVNVGTGAARVDLKAAAVATGGLQVRGSLKVIDGYFAANGPAAKSTATYTVVDTDSYLIFSNAAGTNTITLPSAGAYSGRVLTVKTTQNQALVSASANVAPLAGGVAGTAILTATAGKWATLVSDGMVWQIMSGN